MIAMSTFVDRVYDIVEQFSKSQLPVLPTHPGPPPKLERTAVLTLALLGQWGRFGSERSFYRYAEQCLGDRFGALPHRSQYNRQLRRYSAELALLGLWISQMSNARECVFQIIDTTPIRVRDSRRRGNSWLLGDGDIGHSSRLGWFYGIRLLVAVGAYGAITGFCIAPASTGERALAEALFALRHAPSPHAPSIGLPARSVYLADSGFAGKRWLPRWAEQYGALVIAREQHASWSKPVRRWLAHHRQIIEAVFAKLHRSFGLEHERPHTIAGLQARLAAKVALHNLMIWLNRCDGRPAMQTEDVLAWN
jgi:DDE family transposase